MPQESHGTSLLWLNRSHIATLALCVRCDANHPLKGTLPFGSMVPFLKQEIIMQTIQTVQPDNVICVLLDIHLWSGRQALKREHLIESNATLAALPPAELASMGSVKICDPAEVRVFQRLKNEAIRVLEDNGVPLLGAVAIPAKSYDEVHKKLTDIGNRFDALAQDLLTRYDTEAARWRTKWAAQNPQHAHLLRRMPDAQSVVGRLSFGFHPYAIQPPRAQDKQHSANELFNKQLKGLKGELLNTAAAEANDLLTKYLVSKESGTKREHITQKTLRPFKRISAKLRSFAFVDPCVQPLADVIDSVLASLPADGQVEGAGLISVWNLATLLSNPVSASRIAEQASREGADTALKALEPIAMQATPQSTADAPAQEIVSVAPVAPQAPAPQEASTQVVPAGEAFALPFSFGL